MPQIKQRIEKRHRRKSLAAVFSQDIRRGRIAPPILRREPNEKRHMVLVTATVKSTMEKHISFVIQQILAMVTNINKGDTATRAFKTSQDGIDEVIGIEDSIIVRIDENVTQLIKGLAILG